MNPIEVLHELRLVQKKFKDEKPYTFGLRVADMAKDAADALEEVLMMQGEWLPVDTMPPTKPEYDWVLVRCKLMPEEYYGVPHVAELRDGDWYDSHGNIEELYSVKVTHWMPLPLEQSREVQHFLNKKMNIINNHVIGVDLANGPDISVDRDNQKIGKSCKGCTFDGPTCTNQHICIKDDLGYYTGYVSTTTNPYIQNAVNREEDDGYPCHDSDCYDRGNYHFSCYTCPKIKNSKTVRNDRNETLNMVRERLGLLDTDNTDIDWRFKV